MDEKDRLTIKKHLLNCLQHSPIKINEQEISSLPYHYLEIADPESDVIESLVEWLDLDELEGGLTDEVFFECIKDSPDYLAYEPFRRKIKSWKKTLHLADAEKKDKDIAKKNLKKIGSSLAYEGQGRPLEYDHLTFQLRVEFDCLYKKLEPFLKEVQELPSLTQKRKRFQEKFPYWIEYSTVIEAQQRSARVVAKRILCQRHRMSRRTLDDMLPSRQKQTTETKLNYLLQENSEKAAEVIKKEEKRNARRTTILKSPSKT